MQLDYETMHIVLFLNYNLLQSIASLILTAIILALFVPTAIILDTIILATLTSAMPSLLLNRLMSSHFHKSSRVI